MALEDIHKREQYWQEQWQQANIFAAEPKQGQKKFFLTFPYPYVNGLPHIGHIFTMMRVEAFARYKRQQGHNVLFPQAWHATGSPITTAALRVTENDQKQVQILKDLGVKEEEISQFKAPEHWIHYFFPRYKQDLASVGMSIDWRREFITTSLNPQYDAFIKWQFTKLQEKGYVQKGKHPVVWCQKEQAPVSDHARSVGEGETPQEFTLLKFPLTEKPDTFLIAATLRPETVYGQTNLWVGKDIDYVEVAVSTVHGPELWIVSEPCVAKLELQEHSVERVRTIRGKELLGKTVTAPVVNRPIPILPSHFCSEEKGTGIVTSVPSDAPDDWMGLRDLEDPAVAEKEGISYNIIAEIKPIPIIKSSDLGDMAAVTICEQMNIKNQHDRQKLEEAKKTVYKKGYYEGTMLIGPYAGESVQWAKDKVKKDLLTSGAAELFYELTGKVVCRCQTPSVIKIVADQWFICYGNEEWKKNAHNAVAKVKLYPEKVRQQFDYVIDWLNDWACTREYGLGTRLPWDERWLIESLSDSTIYMAYYTISHKIKDVAVQHLTPAFFDYVYLGKGKMPVILGVDVQALREEFLYWYPVDFRNSGKDLVQNHLSFFLFNHTAIFPEEHWPRGIGVNGWVTVNGQKMSKSLGNVILVRNLIAEYGADATRITILNGGEGLDDPNWDSNFARNVLGKIGTMIHQAENFKGKNDSVMTPVDAWFRSTMNVLIEEITAAMEETNFRTAIQLTFFEYTQMMKWYLIRTMNKPNNALFSEAIEKQVILLAPFIPHACEEAWKRLGKEGFVSSAQWPSVDDSVIDDSFYDAEEIVRKVSDDVLHVMQQSKNHAPKKILLFLAAQWKREAYQAFDNETKRTRNPAQIMAAVSATPLGSQGQELSRLIAFLVKAGRVAQAVPSVDDEKRILSDAAPYLSSIAHGAIVEILDANARDILKAKNGLPGKPAVVLE